MIGFDPKFRDFPDYILGITHEIWEERGVDTLHHYYAPDIVVRSPASVVIGNQTVIDATLATLAEFPDRQLLGEDVIWSGTPEDGMLSSHRILSTATHTSDGAYGPATGTKLVYRVIADCHAIANQINDEWLIRDQGSIVRQLGQTPRDFARAQIVREGGHNASSRPFTPTADKQGPYTGHGNDNEWGQRYADALAALMAGKDADGAYDRAVHGEYAGGFTTHGREAARAFWHGLRQAFPSARFTIHHQIGRDDSLMPPRAAIRWSLDGTHDGPGPFGPPTGAKVHVMGMAHADFGALVADSPLIRREYALIDETAIWKQILLHTGET